MEKALSSAHSIKKADARATTVEPIEEHAPNPPDDLVEQVDDKHDAQVSFPQCQPTLKKATSAMREDVMSATKKLRLAMWGKVFTAGASGIDE